MIPFEEALASALNQLGLGEPAVMLEVRREWESVAGAPWVGKAHPSHLQRGVLVVEVSERAHLPLLRYAVADLERRLRDRFGSESVQGVELVVGSRPGRESV
ncbi:MAG: DciA family protein [Actinomycetota bacterium]